MHVNRFGNLTESQRLKVTNPVFEKSVLLVHDIVHHFKHGLLALFNRLDQPVCAVQLIVNEIFSLSCEILAITGYFLVGTAQSEPGNIGIVDIDHVLAFDLLYSQVRNDIVVISATAVKPARFGFQMSNLVSGVLNLFQAQTSSFGDLLPVPLGKLLEIFTHKLENKAVFPAFFPELNQQAFFQIACAHTQWFQALNDSQYM